MKCSICKGKCDGKLIMKDPDISLDMVCCKTCFNLWVNQDYDKLTKIIKKGAGE